MTGKFAGHRGIPTILSVLAIGVGLSACSGVQKQLGLERVSPDEFAVVSRAPLSLPPDVNLRPPQPGAARPQEGTMTDAAAASLFEGRPAPSEIQVEDPAGSRPFPPREGDVVDRGGLVAIAPSGTVERAVSQSYGERAILRAAGADQALPNIRQIVNAESTELASANESFTDRILFWRDPLAPGTIVDADEERRRLQENEALGRPTTVGETPRIERESRALLEGLFDF